MSYKVAADMSESDANKLKMMNTLRAEIAAVAAANKHSMKRKRKYSDDDEEEEGRYIVI